MEVTHRSAILIGIGVVLMAVALKLGQYIASFCLLVALGLWVQLGGSKTEPPLDTKEGARASSRSIEQYNEPLPKPVAKKIVPKTAVPENALRPLNINEKEEATSRYRRILGLKRTKYSLIEVDKCLDYVLRILLSENESGGAEHEKKTTGEMVGYLRRLDERTTTARKSTIRKHFFSLGTARSVRNRVAHAQDYEPDIDSINKALQSYEDFLTAAIQLS